MRAIIVDDEAPARRKLARMLAAGGVEVAGEAADAEAARRCLEAQRPELAFLDIEMPGASGLELAAAAARMAPAPQIIFVTAHDAFAVRAFELHACDYLLKPYDQRRLDDVLAHARARVAAARSAAAPKLPVVVANGTTVMLDPAALAWAAAAGNYVELHLEDGRTLLTRTTLAAVAARLGARHLDAGAAPPDAGIAGARVDASGSSGLPAFVRLNRSVLVRWSAIEQTRKLPHGELRVRVRGGSEHIWTRRFRKAADVDAGPQWASGPSVPAPGPFVPK